MCLEKPASLRPSFFSASAAWTTGHERELRQRSIVLADGQLHDFREFSQELVSRFMAVPVIEVLEPVHVAHDESVGAFLLAAVAARVDFLKDFPEERIDRLWDSSGWY